MSDPFIGEIKPVAFNFPPRGWAFCEGQLLPINQNQALFSLLGTTYGGNGQTTFALPDLRGRVPIGSGTGPGLSPKNLGERAGAESITLLQTEIPAHTHTVRCAGAATTQAAAGNVPAVHQSHNIYAPTGAETFAADAVGITGGSQPHDNMAPYLTIGYAIALQGIFPSR